MNPPAGWHPDPHDPAIDRYWDGAQWTGQTRPRAGVPIPPAGDITAAPAAGIPGAQPAKKKSKLPWIAGGVVVAIAGVATLGSGASKDDDESQAAATSTSAAPAAAEPVQPATYTLHEDGKRGYRALVQTAETPRLQAAWKQIRTQLADTMPAGGYFVTFDCAIGDDPDEAANRLANAKVAIGALGAAQTGLKEGGNEFKMNKGARCGEDQGFHATIDRAAPITEQSATDICRERIEDEYTAEQLPVSLSDVHAVEGAQGKWAVTGTAQGTSKYGTDAAVMCFSCNVWKTDTGTLMRDLPVFTTK
ncbi:DUF2510 domain-containing protein [Prescottella equi]|uniref:DUF2510 domain-containing protein n=1 Tax=Rhodococcus hoagii TaxID=43767 RepID=UPI0011A44417|nr:DUF2510 domain-containing protein [Prescottella equi]